MASVDERRTTLRRSLGWALVGGLTIAAVTASVALVSGSFDDDDWRVIGTSLGFAVFTAVGAAGVSLRLSGGGRERLLGGVTAALACSHASLVTNARRPTDSDAVSALVTISIGLAAIDAVAGILPLAEVVEDVEEGVVEVIGVLVVGLLLPPRSRRSSAASRGRPPRRAKRLRDRRGSRPRSWPPPIASKG